MQSTDVAAMQSKLSYTGKPLSILTIFVPDYRTVNVRQLFQLDLLFILKMHDHPCDLQPRDAVGTISLCFIRPVPSTPLRFNRDRSWQPEVPLVAVRSPPQWIGCCRMLPGSLTDHQKSFLSANMLDLNNALIMLCLGSVLPPWYSQWHLRYAVSIHDVELPAAPETPDVRRLLLTRTSRRLERTARRRQFWD